MTASQANAKNITVYHCHSSSLWVLALAALVGAAPSALADCDCNSPWVINYGESCVLTDDCVVKRLTISYGGRLYTGAHTLTITGTGGLTICWGGKLIVDGAGTVVLSGRGRSSVDGSIQLQCAGSTLMIADNDHTLTGCGWIEGWDDEAQILITDGETLTSEITIQGALTIDQVSGSATFLNRGLVHANRTGPGCVLNVATATIDDNAGNRWRVSNSASATLRFSSDATGLVGRFDVDNGTLDIDETVCTAGDLSFTGGTIDVAPGRSFAAGGSCP